MTEQELLEEVKEATNFSGEHQTGFVEKWLNFAKGYMANGGVADEALYDKGSVGVIAAIITDMIDNGGVTAFTDKLVAQLALTHPRKEV